MYRVRKLLLLPVLVLPGGLLLLLRYILKTLQPVASILPGDDHIYKWTHGHIFYKVHGDINAPPLLLFHAPGLGASAHEMFSLVEELASHYCIYAPDLLGFGLLDLQLHINSVTYHSTSLAQVQAIFLNDTHYSIHELASQNIATVILQWRDVARKEISMAGRVQVATRENATFISSKPPLATSSLETDRLTITQVEILSEKSIHFELLYSV